ncbi:DUF1840 domain-containing protein [Paraburkholderia gardini]|jgi:hypothetical protein|uniref:DUF1840 domain-containing protein n=1 Tax=Paraburkholderia gardini TaxID=2823469 RepID=A0ABM8U0I4_9BURK|nr:DUF1840 domain-containing protein [Paraburkholderia gardini]CAG4892361.1 hypothetical protein R54767_01287 [Paraburkholderia gardini]CAG4899304.1 hypothetical protein R69919_02589 [Paraburkholderia gardini]
MLITFQSPATPDVVMLRELAQYLLGLVGKRLDARGVILHDELPGAIRRVEAAISDDEKAELALESLQFPREHGQESGSGLSQPAWSFLDMMREAREHNADIIWKIPRALQ